MSQYDFPTPPNTQGSNTPESSTEAPTPPTSPSLESPPVQLSQDVPRTTNISQKILWGAIGIIVGMLVGGVIVSMIVNLIISLASTAVMYDLSTTDEAKLVKSITLIIGMALGLIIGYILAVSDPVRPSRSMAALTTEQKAETETAAQKMQNDSLSYNFKRAVRFTGFLFVDTIRLLLPSAIVSTKRSDTPYIDVMNTTFIDMIKEIDLSEKKKAIVTRNWLPQIDWTNNRANRERDANEMMSWWQIILTALIPFIATADSILGLKSTNVVAILGIFITVLTGLIRFRRPEERWKHYRRLTEDYQREMWNYISLSGPYRVKRKPDEEKYKDHDELFKDFNEKMTSMRENDIRVFLGEVMNNAPAQISTQGTQDQTRDTTPVTIAPPGTHPISPDNG